MLDFILSLLQSFQWSLHWPCSTHPYFSQARVTAVFVLYDSVDVWKCGNTYFFFYNSELERLSPVWVLVEGEEKCVKWVSSMQFAQRQHVSEETRLHWIFLLDLSKFSLQLWRVIHFLPVSCCRVVQLQRDGDAGQTWPPTGQMT